MDEIIDIWSSEYSYLDSDDDWLSPARGTLSARIKSIDLDEWLNDVFTRRSSSTSSSSLPPVTKLRSGTNGNLSTSNNNHDGGGENGASNGCRVIDQRTRRIQPSPSRRPGIPNAFETPPDVPSTQEIRVINTNTVTKIGAGVERTKTFTRKRSIETSFIKNATITKARIARRGTFSRGQMPFNSNPFNLTSTNGSNDCDDDHVSSHDMITYTNGVDNHCDYDDNDDPVFNHGFVQSTPRRPNSGSNLVKQHQSTNELNRQATITKKFLPSNPTNGHLNNYLNGNSNNNGQHSLLNASSAPNLHAVRSREQIATTTTVGGNFNGHGTITKSSSRILTRIPKSNSSSRESLLTNQITSTTSTTTNLPRLRPPQTMVKPPMIRK